MILAFCFFSSKGLFSQLDSALDLSSIKVIEQYDGDGMEMNIVLEQTYYRYRGKKWSTRKYNKYFGPRENVWDCKPCILKTYAVKKHILLEERVAYTACDIGYIKKYFPSGTIQYIGNYYYDTSISSDSLIFKNRCSIPDGEWIYFNEEGDTLYKENWEKGIFISQIPEQNRCEIWDVILSDTYNDSSITEIAIEDVKILNFQPLYKNQNKNAELRIKVFIGRGGLHAEHGIFSVAELKDQNFKLPLKTPNYNDTEDAFIGFEIYNDDNRIKSFWIKLKE